MRNIAIIKSLFLKLKILFANQRNAENEYLKKRIILLEKLMEEKTDSVDRAKSIFLKNLYHEIRTPLNAIVGFSDLIEMNSLSNKDKVTYINHIRESSKEFLRKMDNIIEASIIEAGLIKLSDDECNIFDLFSEVHSYFSIQKHLCEKEIVFLLSVPVELRELTIQCDAYRLTQVLSNLVSNAFKFCSQGVIELGYLLTGNEIEIFVRDSGIGGLEGKEELIYKNFAKLDDSEDSKDGLGLGLSLSKKLVDLMKGRMWFNSITGKGTTFYFTIPYHPIARAENHLKIKSTEKPNIIKNTIRNSAVL
jgi:signal transduction histidine kinase